VREIRRWRISGGLFIGLGVPLNYQAFTNDSLTLMYEGVRGALASDDTTKAQGGETRFRVRETPDWKQPAADLDSEMLKRECFSKSSIGRKIRRSFRSSDEAFRASVSTATAFLLASGRSEVSGPRLRQLAGRYPMAVAGLLIAIFNQLLTHETPDAVAVPVHQDSPLVSPSAAAAQSRDEARPPRC